MLAKRIIPCLDVDDGRVKKGINFVNLRDVGDPAEIAANYQRQGADELVFLDITATNEQRRTMVDVVEKVSCQVFMPLTVGGGISSVDQIQALLKAGADKVSLNSAAVADPQLITAGAKKFGNQCIVVAIDVKTDPQTGQLMVYTHGGQQATDLEAVTWAKKVVALGAGELLVTSMDQDGTKDGFAIELYQKLVAAVDVPIIASGGAGKIQDFIDVFQQAQVDGALAASVFHYGELTIPEVKQRLKAAGVSVRC
ncbi:imidazole glycerol phosphate synthase subunit HisF [Liquorilactobacillus sicerae]|uniref:imidazole glycerol phosphate synthase subunit HisF n=1 Tax=Liquorilactobacillus sicerae TaxID=1416943 RepID=UPI00248080CC|nr:imidazole glycerol phosphate synthase subunit HisF [Liquorilactobacillus sicerae]